MHWFGRNDKSTLESVAAFLRQQAIHQRGTARLATTQRDRGQYLAAAGALDFAAQYIEEAVPNGRPPKPSPNRRPAFSPPPADPKLT